MKSLFTIALGLALLILVTSFDVGAVDGPHADPVKIINPSCTSCHNSSLPSDSITFNSNCLSCHSDFSTGTNSAEKLTSHKWTGSVANPAVGAQSPATLALSQVQSYTGNQLSCVNCHNPHTSGNGKYQRIANDRDQLCLDCHRSRNVQTATTGSHSVLIGYSSAAKAAPSKFVGKMPVNANPANPKSDLGSTLSNDGKLLCSTCHGVHSADSRSSNYVNGFKMISTGDGNLLRTNPRGDKVAAGSVDKVNICTNCHAGKVNHNAAGQDIQCIDCHGAHVEYDPNDPTNTKGTNVSLIRRNLPGKTNQILFRYTGSSREYKNVDGTGVCQGCHAVPTSVAQHASTDPKVCNTCHTHNSIKGAFTASCDSCHGFPPSAASGDAAHPNNTNCGLCHNTDPSVHMNGAVDVSTNCDACHGYPPAYANGSPKANSHNSPGHLYICNTCHAGTTATGTTITNTSLHMNGVNDVQAGPGVSFTYTYAATGGTCNNISCHGNTSATWGGSVACLVCHSLAQGNRAAITSQFSANSHHIQGTISDAHCYQCHWEANSDGSVNGSYHHSNTSGAPVELVIYGAGSRPAAYVAGVTAIQYTANGTRSEIQKINSHCLGCHSDQNNTATPFGDGKTPKQYAWDGTSVAARYSQAGTTTWGKYANVPNAAQKNIEKSFSAHGNSLANKRGWDATTGVDGTITDTSGAVNVLCYDCHNSHGSTVTGTTTRYASATANGGILKTTVAGQSGYTVAYKPELGGSIASKDNRNPGASLCLDCHQNQAAGTTPWGYTSTYGATQPILGYWDSPFMGYSTCGPEQRYPFKKKNDMKGGHFGASMVMSSTPAAAIDGLCTPCHDPHGVSPTLGSDQQYAVPLLKGTWLTSPYKEDVAPAINAAGTTFAEGVQYHIDQNTFASGGITQPVTKSAGLCLGCHPQSSLTDGVTHTWKSKDRVHEAVMGWKTADATKQHSYTCSKCHSAHTSSVLPRLMVTNCLDSRHKGRSAYNPSAVISGSGSGDESSCSSDIGACNDWGTWPGWGSGSGAGNFPGNFSGSAVGNNPISCHEGNTGSGTDQSWNMVTPWAPAIISGPSAVTGGLRVLMHMDETLWNGAPNEVKDSSGGNNNGSASGGANIVAGGISGRAGNFNGAGASVPFTYASGSTPVDNFTLEAWIKPTATHEVEVESSATVGGVGGQRYLFWPDQMGATNGGAGISAGTNGITVYEHGDNYMPPLAVYSGTISSSQWTHIAVVYLDKRPSIYVNGVLVRTGLRSPRAHVYASHTIGGGVYGYFSGLIDEVAIYDKALTTADIQMHSQQQCPVISSSVDASINWTTFVNSTSYVDYGLTKAYGSTTGSSALVTDHSVNLPNLTNNTTYHYRVRSENASGNETVSNDYTFNVATCVVAEPPFAATSISAIPGNAQASISWTAGSGSTSSSIRYGTTSGNYTTTIDPATSPQTITSLTNGTPVYYQVGAKNAAGTTWSAEYSVTSVGPPSAPTVISAVAGNSQATISWTAGLSSTSSLIRYGTTSGVYTATIDPATSPRVITGLVNGTPIYYQVGAKNSAGTTWSAQYSVTPMAPPSGPTGIWSATGNAQATISWTAGTGATSSLIRYGTTSGVDTITIDPATSPQTITSLVNGTSYYYQVGAKNTGGTTWSASYFLTPAAGPPSAPTGISSVAGNVQATISWTAGAGSTSSFIRYGTTSGVYTTTIYPATSPRVISGLINGTTYYYQVGSYNTAGLTWSVQYSVTPVGPPSAPSAITSVAGNTQATISWTVSTGTTSSLIRYGTTSGVYTTTIDPATSPQTITGLVNGTTYYYQVGAKNLSGTTWSTQSSLIPVVPPTAPTGISAAMGDTQVTISWVAGAGSTSSTIRYGTASGVYTTTIATAASPQAITGLTNGTTVYYQVGAKNSAGTAWSSEYSIIPLAPPATPTGISVTTGNAQATISWTAGTDATSSLIRYGTATGVYTTTLDPATSPKTITGLAIDTPVYYQVGARNTGGTTWSAEFSFTISASNIQTWWSTPGTYAYVVPSGVTSITAIVKGGGGAGGLIDNVYNQAAGANGDLVSTVVAVTPGSQLTVYVASGGNIDNYDESGGAGGSGYHIGSIGGLGEGDYGGAWAYGGSGGGGSSAITLSLSSTLLIEAAGGIGGRSSDYDDTDNCFGDCNYHYGGYGGAGGGSDYPAATTPGGGGSGGGFEVNGGYGSVSISYSGQTLPAPTGISAIAGNAQATISWTAGSGSTSSSIRYGTTSGTYTSTIDPANSPQTIASLVNGTTYYYQVGAKYGAGTTWSAEYSVTSLSPPVVSPPAAPTVTPVGGYYYDLDASQPPTSPIILQWTAVTVPAPYSSDPVEYNVELNGTLQGWQSGTSLPINVGDSLSYTWRVQARDKAQPTAVSPWSGFDTFMSLYW